MASNNKQWGMFKSYFADIGANAPLSSVAYAYPVRNNGLDTMHLMEMPTKEANYSNSGKVYLSRSEKEKLDLSVLSDKFFEF